MQLHLMCSTGILPLDVNKLVWELAADKKPVRYAAFDVVNDGLALHARREPLNYLTMMRLWKGLYYLLWKEDKVNMQYDLCKKISGLIHLLPEPTSEDEEAFAKNYGDKSDSSSSSEGGSEYEDTASYGGQAVLFARCGLETLCREWPLVDYLRQSKVMRLVRDFVYALIERILLSYNDCPLEGDMIIHTINLVLLNNSRIVQQSAPKSLVMHFSDVWADGIRKGIKKTCSSQPFNEEQLTHLLLPWIEFVATSTDVEVSEAVGTNIFSRVTDINYNPPENFAEYIQMPKVDENGEKDAASEDNEDEDEDISLMQIVMTMAEQAKEFEKKRKGVSTKCVLNIKKSQRPWEKRMRGHVDSYRYAETNPHAKPGAHDDESDTDSDSGVITNKCEYKRGNKLLSNSEILEQFGDELYSMCEWWEAEGKALLKDAQATQEPPQKILRKEEIAFIEAKQYLNHMVYATYKDELHNIRISRRGLLVYDPKIHERVLRTEDYAVIKPVLLSQLDPAKIERLFGPNSGIADELGTISKGPEFYAREDLEDTDSIDADRSSSDSGEEIA